MTRFGFTLIATGVFAASLQAASAADLRAAPAYKAPPPIAAAYNWTGFYIGANGGYAWGKSRDDFSTGTTTGDYNVSGGQVGGTVGYNFQTGAWVLGVEGDVDWSSVKGSTACPNAAFTCSTENSWLSTVRGRLGYAAGPALFYVTGGGAFGDIKYSAVSAAASFADKANRAGWTAGGGIEYGFAPNWSAKVEYLYVRLNDFSCGVTCTGAANETVNVKLSESLLRIGINYRFGPAPVVARY